MEVWGIKEEVLEERKDFWTLGTFLERQKGAREGETREKRREKGRREQNPSQKQHHFD